MVRKQDFIVDPASCKALALLLVRFACGFAQPAKVRLRTSSFAQDDALKCRSRIVQSTRAFAPFVPHCAKVRRRHFTQSVNAAERSVACSEMTHRDVACSGMTHYLKFANVLPWQSHFVERGGRGPRSYREFLPSAHILKNLPTKQNWRAETDKSYKTRTFLLGKFLEVSEPSFKKVLTKNKGVWGH